MSTRCAQTSLPEARLRPKLWPPFPELLLQKATNTRLETRSALQGLSELAPIGGGHHCLIMKPKCLLCQPLQRLTSCVFLSCLSSSLLLDCRASEPQLEFQTCGTGPVFMWVLGILLTQQVFPTILPPHANLASYGLLKTSKNQRKRTTEASLPFQYPSLSII